MGLTPFMTVIDLQFLSILFFYVIWIHSPTDFNSNILIHGPCRPCWDHSSHLLSGLHITISSSFLPYSQSSHLFKSALHSLVIPDFIATLENTNLAMLIPYLKCSSDYFGHFLQLISYTLYTLPTGFHFYKQFA